MFSCPCFITYVIKGGYLVERVLLGTVLHCQGLVAVEGVLVSWLRPIAEGDILFSSWFAFDWPMFGTDNSFAFEMALYFRILFFKCANINVILESVLFVNLIRILFSHYFWFFIGNEWSYGERYFLVSKAHLNVI